MPAIEVMVKITIIVPLGTSGPEIRSEVEMCLDDVLSHPNSDLFEYCANKVHEITEV
jgi:hypothetical protein